MLNLHRPVNVNFDYHPAIISTITCAPPMRVRFVCNRKETLTRNGGYMCEPWPGHFELPITLKFVVRNIQCRYSFS